MSLIAVGAVCIITCHDTYELRRRLRHAATHGQKRVIFTRVIILWIASITSLLVAFLTNIDNQTKEARLSSLSSRLSQTISKEDHDRFVSLLKTVPKGEVPVWHEYASVATYNLIDQIRQMLADAGFKTNASDPHDRVDIDVDGQYRVRTDVLILVKSPDDKPSYTEPLYRAFNAIGIPVDYFPVNDGMKGIDKDHIALLILNAE